MGNSVYKLIIQILGQDKGASRELQQTQREVEGVESASKAMNTAINLAAVAGMGYMAKQAASAAWELGELGAKAMRAESAFSELASQAGGSADAIMAAIQRASGGTISELDAMMAANKGMLLGLGAQADQWEQLTEVARYRARAMGLSVTQALDDITEGIGKESRLRLDNLGIILDTEQVMKSYAQTIGKTADSLDAMERKQALLNSVITDGQRLIKEAGGIANDAADNFEIAARAMDDLRVSWGKLVAGPVSEMALEVAGSLDLLRVTGDLAAAAAEGRISWNTFFDTLGRLDRVAFEQGAAAAESLAREVIRTGQAVEFATGVHGDWTLGLGRGEQAAHAAALGLGGLTEEYYDLAGAIYTANTVAARGAAAIYEYRRGMLVGEGKPTDLERLIQINEDFIDGLGETESAWKRTVNSMENEWNNLRSTVQAALQPSQVTSLDLALAGAGGYQEKWDENARRLDAIAARGFAEMDAHPDWAGILEIPPNVLAAGEEALKSWADQTADAVRSLERPDLLNIGAAVQAVQDELNRQAAVELSLDLVTGAAIDAGLVTGEDAQKQVAQLLGLESAPMQIPIELIAGGGGSPDSLLKSFTDGFDDMVSGHQWTATIVSAWESDFSKNSTRIYGAGQLIGTPLWDGLLSKVQGSGIVDHIIAEVIAALAGEL